MLISHEQKENIELPTKKPVAAAAVSPTLEAVATRRQGPLPSQKNLRNQDSTSHRGNSLKNQNLPTSETLWKVLKGFYQSIIRISSQFFITISLKEPPWRRQEEGPRRHYFCSLTSKTAKEGKGRISGSPTKHIQLIPLPTLQLGNTYTCTSSASTTHRGGLITRSMMWNIIGAEFITKTKQGTQGILPRGLFHNNSTSRSYKSSKKT